MITRFWRRWFLLVEPLLGALAVGVVVYWSECSDGWSFLQSYLDETRPTLYGTLAGLAGSLLGFVLAAFAITVASLGSRRLDPVHRHARVLVLTFSAATFYLGTTTLISLLAIFFDRDQRPVSWLFYGVLLSLVLATIGVARCVWILHNVVAIVSEPSKTRAAND